MSKNYDPGICPNCGSEDLVFTPLQDEDECTRYYGKCNSCHSYMAENNESVFICNETLTADEVPEALRKLLDKKATKKPTGKKP